MSGESISTDLVLTPSDASDIAAVRRLLEGVPDADTITAALGLDNITDHSDAWRIVHMDGRGVGTITHPLMAVAPGCPAVRHPTSTCRCRPHRDRKTALAYINQQALA